MDRPVSSRGSVLGFTTGLLVAVALGLSPASAEEKKPAPEVKLEIFPESEAVEQDEQILLTLCATNLSDVDLVDLRLHPISTRFDVERVRFPATLPAFGSVQASLKVWPRSGPEAGYGSRKILFLLDYRWRKDGRSFSTTRAAVASLNVRRKFEEETGGLLGGSTALFYLLLPILPAYLAYQVAEGLRKGEGMHLPALSKDHLLAAFFLAVAANILFLLLPLGGIMAFDYSDPRTLAKVLAFSLLLGVLVPAGRAFGGWWRMRIWGIREEDSLTAYLEKALLAPGSPRRFHWATAVVGGADWQGILLVQPNERQVLGPQVQIGVSPRLLGDDYEGAKVEAVDLLEKIEGGAVEARKTLIERVRQGTLTVSPARFVLGAGKEMEKPLFFVEARGGEIAVKTEEPRPLAIFPGGQ